MPFSGGCSYFAIIMGNPKFLCWNKTALKKSTSCSKILVFYIFLSIVTSALTYCFRLFTEDLSVLPIILILSLTPSGRWGDLIRPYRNLNISTIFVGSEPNKIFQTFERTRDKICCFFAYSNLSIVNIFIRVVSWNQTYKVNYNLKLP